jgi:hypothetical protein
MAKKLLIGGALFALVLSGCTTSISGKAVLQVQASLDLGQVRLGETKTGTVSVTNTGTGTLVISGVSTSCGCTEAHISSTTIAPGESADLSISYNSSFPEQVVGLLSRQVYIRSNASNPTVIINVSAELLP